MTTTMLDIRDLYLSFDVPSGTTDVLRGISLSISAGEIVALVGESGSGKSVTARIVLGLLQRLRSANIDGSVRFNGREIATLSQREFRSLRGRDISMIFQDPTNSLNPVYTIGRQFRDVLARKEGGIRRWEAAQRAAAALSEVMIDDPERVLASYPFQLSGGMNQRVVIAMALVNEPRLLLADEPGTALDVTVQAKTLHLMHDLVRRHRTSVLFISHNLGVVRESADRVYVIYKGRIVETGPVASLFANPRHPYTRALMNAVPKLTGGGLPEIAEAEDFSAPIEVHVDAGVNEGAAE
jgi:peptide/nickel transport system ATP-binding protein